MKPEDIRYGRDKISSKEIADRRDFNQIVSALKQPPNPFWKSIGFWGTTGTAVLATFFLMKALVDNFNSNNNKAYENKITLNKTDDNLPADTECITPTFNGEGVAFETFEINPNEAQTIKLQNGSLIHISEGTFINLDDTPIEIRTRVFEDKTSAFIAGIPMDFKDQAFESAGMIEIRGFQNGEIVDINPQNPIEVELKLYKNPEGFGFYSLDDKSGKWTEYPSNINSNSLSVNHSKLEELKTALEIVKSELNNVEKELTLINHPKKEDYKLPKFSDRHIRLEFRNNEFPELTALGISTFEVLPNQVDYNRINDRTWSNIELKEFKSGVFIMEFSDMNTSKSLRVRPVLNGKKLDEALAKYNDVLTASKNDEQMLVAKKDSLSKVQAEKQKSLDELTAKRLKALKVENYDNDGSKSIEERRNRFKTNNLIIDNSANFSITRWGVYNCDRPLKYPEPFPNTINFVAQNKSMMDIKAAYVFDLDKDVRYSFVNSNRDLSAFGINKSESMVLILYKNGDIAYAKVDDRNQILLDNKITLTPVNAKDVKPSLIKELLNEDRITA